MSGKPKVRRMTEEDFAQIKALAAVGLSSGKIAKVINRGSSTVLTAAKAKDFAEYKAVIAAQIAKSNKKLGKKPYLPAEKLVEVAHTQPQPLPSLTEQQQTYHMLERIAMGIERLADAWERKPKPQVTIKRGLFGKGVETVRTDDKYTADTE